MRAILRTLSPVFAVLLVAESGGAQPAVPPELREARRAIAAASERADKAAYARLLTDDATWVNRAGRLQNKASMVSELQLGSPTTAEPDIRTYPGGAVLIGTRDGNVRFMQLWVLNAGLWQLAAHQGTTIAGATPAPDPFPSLPASSKPPADSGRAADIAAIAKAMDAVSAANGKGDGQAFGALVADRFVSVTAQGQVRSKQERIQEVTGRPGPVPVGVRQEMSTRVHGDLAVTTLLPPVPAGQPRLRQTVIHVRQGGAWLRAATIMTAIATRP